MWDGLLCWGETPAGMSVTQNCPDHPDLDPAGKNDLDLPNNKLVESRAMGIWMSFLPNFLIPGQQATQRNDPVFSLYDGGQRSWRL